MISNSRNLSAAEVFYIAGCSECSIRPTKETTRVPKVYG